MRYKGGGGISLLEEVRGIWREERSRESAGEGGEGGEADNCHHHHLQHDGDNNDIRRLAVVKALYTWGGKG